MSSESSFKNSALILRVHRATFGLDWHTLLPGHTFGSISLHQIPLLSSLYISPSTIICEQSLLNTGYHYTYDGHEILALPRPTLLSILSRTTKWIPSTGNANGGGGAQADTPSVKNDSSHSDSQLSPADQKSEARARSIKAANMDWI